MASFNLHAPTAPTPKDAKFWSSVFPKLNSNYKVLAPEQEEGDDGIYNCLGWVTGQVKDFGGNHDFDEDTLKATRKLPIDKMLCYDMLTFLVAKLGLVPCGEAEATVDVWYLPGDTSAEHVSKKDPTTGKWTSKLGTTGPLIEHERNALEGSDYGSVKYHFGPAKAGTASVQSLSVEPEPGHAMESAPEVTEEDIATVEGHAALFTSLTVAPNAAPRPKAPIAQPTPAKPAAPATPVTPAKPAPSKPTAPVKPAPTKPTTPAKPTPTNPVTAQFEKVYIAWKATWKDTKVRISSR